MIFREKSRGGAEKEDASVCRIFALFDIAQKLKVGYNGNV